MFQRFLILFLVCLPTFAWATAARVSPQTALEGVRAKAAIVLDVREADEIAHGKIENAHVFPTSKIGKAEWTQFVSSLPKDKEIYIYCRSGGRADKVAEDLRALGFKASSTGGYKDWLAAGAKSN